MPDTRYATDSDLTTRLPETAAVDSALRAIALDDAEAEIDLDSYGAKAIRAHCYLAAHYLVSDGSLADRGRTGTSLRLDTLGATFAQTQGSDGPHGSTGYGQRFDEITSRLAHGIGSI